MSCFDVTPGGLRLRLRVQPKSRRAGPQGYVATPADGPGADGSAGDGGTLALKFGINAAPEDGKANAAIIALLAKRLHVAKAAISVAAGAKDRRKVIDIQGPSAALAAALTAWLADAIGPTHDIDQDGT